jgi:hypothetical protein
MLHVRGTWSAREDRLPSAVWLGVLWVGMIAGFGVDFPRYLHENPPPPRILHLHAVVFTVWMLLLTAQVLLVLRDRVAWHRRLGWFAAVWACVGDFAEEESCCAQARDDPGDDRAVRSGVLTIFRVFPDRTDSRHSVVFLLVLWQRAGDCTDGGLGLVERAIDAAICGWGDGDVGRDVCCFDVVLLGAVEDTDDRVGGGMGETF